MVKCGKNDMAVSMAITLTMALTMGLPKLAMAEAGVTMLRGALVQGGYYVGQIAENLAAEAVVKFEGKEIAVMPKGQFVVGFDRHQPARTVLEVCSPMGGAPTCEQVVLKVAPRTWQTQNVKGVPKQNITPNPAQERRVAADNAATKAARAKALTSKWEAWSHDWVWPARGRVSGVYGSRRLFDGAERSWHKGTDVAAPTDTPVVAPVGGVVRLARDTFMSGNLILLDHGYGVTTVYAHLDTMAVAVGEQVKQGQLIGLVGTTGRSSGPHLHWGAYWRGEAIDPRLWVAQNEPEPLTKKGR